MAEKTATEVWSETVEVVERSIGQTDMILKQIRADSFANGILSILVPNAFTRNYIEGEHLKQIHSALRKITGVDTEVKFVIQAESWADESKPKKRESSMI